MGILNRIFSRIGAPAGASIAADIAAVKTETDKTQYGVVHSGDINLLSPSVDQPASAIEFPLAELTDDFIADGEITAVGQIDIYRFRKGTDAGWTAIVTAGTPAGTALGSLNYSYAFPTASWAVGDLVQVHMSGAQVTINGNVFTIPRKTIYGVVGLNDILQDLEDGGRLDLIIDAIASDVQKIDEAAISGTPTASSLATFIATGGTALGTALPASKSLYDGQSGGIDAVNRIMGKKQIKAVTADLHNDAGTYDIVTGTTADIVVESLIFSPRVDVSDDVGGITAISVQTDDTTNQVFISQTEGAIANLTAYNQLGCIAPVLVRAGKKIQFTIYGGTADADPTTCDVIIVFRAVTNGGYLA